MRVDFECVNKECPSCGEVKEKDVNYEDIEKVVCEHCKQLMKRVWSFSGGIKTGDGYK